jgi:hypothetical protein
LVPTTVGYAPNTRGSGIAAMFNQMSFVSDDSWTETGINFNNKPASAAPFATYLSYLNSPLNIDVTSLVQAAQAGQDAVAAAGVDYQQPRPARIDFGSRERRRTCGRSCHRNLRRSTPSPTAYVRDGASASLNFGTTTDLSVKQDTSANSGNNRDAYLKFDLNGVAAAPGGATVRLVPISIAAAFRASPIRHRRFVDRNRHHVEQQTRFGSSIATGHWHWEPEQVRCDVAVAAAIAGDKTLSLRVGQAPPTPREPVCRPRVVRFRRCVRC